MQRFWDIHKEIKDKPCCFLHCDQGLDEEDLRRITAETIERV